MKLRYQHTPHNNGWAATNITSVERITNASRQLRRTTHVSQPKVQPPPPQHGATLRYQHTPHGSGRAPLHQQQITSTVSKPSRTTTTTISRPSIDRKQLPAHPHSRHGIVNRIATITRPINKSRFQQDDKEQRYMHGDAWSTVPISTYYQSSSRAGHTTRTTVVGA